MACIITKNKEVTLVHPYRPPHHGICTVFLNKLNEHARSQKLQFVAANLMLTVGTQKSLSGGGDTTAIAKITPLTNETQEIDLHDAEQLFMRELPVKKPDEHAENARFEDERIKRCQELRTYTEFVAFDRKTHNFKEWLDKLLHTRQEAIKQLGYIKTESPPSAEESRLRVFVELSLTEATAQFNAHSHLYDENEDGALALAPPLLLDNEDGENKHGALASTTPHGGKDGTKIEYAGVATVVICAAVAQCEVVTPEKIQETVARIQPVIQSLDEYVNEFHKSVLAHMDTNPHPEKTLPMTEIRKRDENLGDLIWDGVQPRDSKNILWSIDWEFSFLYAKIVELKKQFVDLNPMLLDFKMRQVLKYNETVAEAFVGQRLRLDQYTKPERLREYEYVDDATFDEFRKGIEAKKKWETKDFSQNNVILNLFMLCDSLKYEYPHELHFDPDNIAQLNADDLQQWMDYLQWRHGKFMTGIFDRCMTEDDFNYSAKEIFSKWLFMEDIYKNNKKNKNERPTSISWIVTYFRQEGFPSRRFALFTIDTKKNIQWTISEDDEDYFKQKANGMNRLLTQKLKEDELIQKRLKQESVAYGYDFGTSFKFMKHQQCWFEKNRHLPGWLCLFNCWKEVMGEGKHNDKDKKLSMELLKFCFDQLSSSSPTTWKDIQIIAYQKFGVVP